MTQHPFARSMVAAIAVALLLGACSGSISFGDNIRGSGALVSARFDVDDFDAVDVSDTFDVVITVGEAPFVEVLANENLIDELDIRVRNGTLKVGLRNGVSLNSGTLEATVRLPELSALDVSGSSEVTVEGSSGSEQQFDVSGASDLEVTGASGVLTIDVSGASNVQMDGTASEVTIDASGSSDAVLDLSGVERADVDLSGASSVELESVATVSGDLSGASDLTVPEGARVDVDSSGSSDVRRS